MKKILAVLLNLTAFLGALWFGHIYFATERGLLWQFKFGYGSVIVTMVLVFASVAAITWELGENDERLFTTLVAMLVLPLFLAILGLAAGYHWKEKGRAVLLSQAFARGEAMICEDRTVLPKEVRDVVVVTDPVSVTEARKCYVVLKDNLTIDCEKCLSKQALDKANLARARSEARLFEDADAAICDGKIVKPFTLWVSPEGCFVVSGSQRYACDVCEPVEIQGRTP